jgi:hypothetical protein
MDISYHVILVQFGKEHHNSSINAINLFLEKNSIIPKNFLILDNSLDYEFEEHLAGNKFLINGDNSSHEFSAWQKGFNTLSESLGEQDIIILANDSFHRNYSPNFTRLFNLKKLKGITSPFISGYADSYIENVRIRNRNSNSWIRTNFFLCNVKALRSLESIVSFKIKDIEGSEDFIKNDKQIFSRNYIELIKEWLIKDIPLSKMPKKWYRSEVLTDKSAKLLRLKALSIINEHSLTAKIRANGGRVIAINSLKCSLSRLKRKLIFRIKKLF